MIWSMSFHATLRVNEMGLTEGEVVDALNWPSVTYPSPPKYGHGRSVAVSGRLAVVHNASTRTIITVLWNGASGRSVEPRAA